jgi:polysaccharide biosynthesis/export protein VpsN
LKNLYSLIIKFRHVYLACVLIFSFLNCATNIPSESLLAAPVGATFNRQGQYVIGSGDKLEIKVQGNPNMDGSYVVSASGQIVLPLVGPQQAVRYSAATLARNLEISLKSVLVDPRVTVNVVSPSSFKVYFLGEIKTPGVFQLTEPTTLMQGIALAGGLTKFSNGKIFVVRPDSKGRTRRYSVTMKELLVGENDLDQSTLERGDYIYLD